MLFSSILASCALLLAGASALEKPLDIDVTHAVGCSKKSKLGRVKSSLPYISQLTSGQGDKVEVHYRGTLEADGPSYARKLKHLSA